MTEAYRQELIDFKNGFYSPLVLIAAQLAMRGGRPTLTPTTRGESTATAHYHFLIEDPEALLASVGAQGKFTPVAISLDDQGSPGFYLTLAVSMREDDPCGLRAAWSTYILNEKNRPRTLQLDEFSSDACLDPVSLLGLPAPVQQAVIKIPQISNSLDFDGTMVPPKCALLEMYIVVIPEPGEI